MLQIFYYPIYYPITIRFTVRFAFKQVRLSRFFRLQSLNKRGSFCKTPSVILRTRSRKFNISFVNRSLLIYIIILQIGNNLKSPDLCRSIVGLSVPHGFFFPGLRSSISSASGSLGLTGSFKTVFTLELSGAFRNELFGGL